MRRALIVLVAVAVSLGASLPSAAGTTTTLIRLFNTGCKVTGAHSHGCLVSNVRGPGAPGPLARGSKTGEACGYNILALFTWGDLRITTAAEQAGITEISSIDHRAFELVPGFYGFSKYCTVVTGE